MNTLIPRYLIGLLVGVVVGLLFPGIPQWILLLCLLTTFVISELLGWWGFGNHWSSYRLSSYALYAAVVVCIWVGTLLGSGMFGRLLVMVGELIS
jgi:hypothetical protein